MTPLGILRAHEITFIADFEAKTRFIADEDTLNGIVVDRQSAPYICSVRLIHCQRRGQDGIKTSSVMWPELKLGRPFLVSIKERFPHLGAVVVDWYA